MLPRITVFFLLALTGTVAAQNPRAERYCQYKFGMFVTWGPYSIASVEASWPLMKGSWYGKISPEDYRGLPERFNPVKFEPKAWVRLAREAGQRYIVFTTKHHDGFCMFDSQFTNYKITNTPYKRDVLKMLADACKDEGMPLGFYYSPPDMNHPAYRDTSKSPHENFRGEPWRPEWPLYLSYMELQLRELLTGYGEVEVLWFDGLGGKGYDPVRMQRVIHLLQPDTALNNRLGMPGDFDTPEQKVPGKVPERPWETCMTINGTWAYNKNDLRFKSPETLIRTLIEVVSKGGNLLLNVGPTPDGEIQPEFAERLRDIGKWLKVNGEAIYGTEAGPLQKVPWGRTTSRGKNIYLHVFEWPNGPLKVQGLRRKIRRVVMLPYTRPLQFQKSGDELTIQVPAQAPDTRATVIRVETR